MPHSNNDQNVVVVFLHDTIFFFRFAMNNFCSKEFGEAFEPKFDVHEDPHDMIKKMPENEHIKVFFKMQ